MVPFQVTFVNFHGGWYIHLISIQPRNSPGWLVFCCWGSLKRHFLLKMLKGDFDVTLDVFTNHTKEFQKISKYKPGTQMTLVFDWKRPCFGGFNYQNRGQLGSRNVYIQLPATNTSHLPAPAGANGPQKEAFILQKAIRDSRANTVRFREKLPRNSLAKNR